MPPFVKTYIRFIDRFNRRLGRITMYMVFLMMVVLFYSAISRAFLPSLWTLEVAQFLMVAYFLLGGPYSLQQEAHVRMDLLYGSWRPKTKLIADVCTIIFLIVYLVVLLYGGISATLYAIEYGERSYSAWRPYMWPIKTLMTAGVFMMLLQAIAIFLRDIARLRGEDL